MTSWQHPGQAACSLCIESSPTVQHQCAGLRQATGEQQRIAEPRHALQALHQLPQPCFSCAQQDVLIV